MATFKTEPRTKEPDPPTANAASRDTVGKEQITRAAGFRRLLETTSIVQWEADARTWAFTYVGPQAVRLLGYPIERWYEPDFWVAHVHPDDRDEAVRFCEQAAQERDAYEFEYRMISASGQIVWLHDVVAVDRLDGAPAVIRGFLIDVTQRKRAEATARASDARLRQLIEQAPDAIIAVRADGQIAFVNRRAERMFGYRRGDLVGEPFEILMPGQLDVERLARDHATEAAQPLSRIGDGVEPVTGVCRDGRSFPADVNLSSLETDEGMVVVTTIRDISERLAAETARRESEERFRLAATLGADIIGETDIETRQVEWSGKVDEVLGYEQGEFPRTVEGWAAQLHPEDRDRVMLLGKEANDRLRGMQTEYRIRAKDGSYRHWTVRTAPILDGPGRPTKIISVCSDVTDQVVARAEALQHRDALAHVARVSSLGELTATLAHELNQPLAAILSDAQAAARLLDRDQPDVPKIREVLRDIVADDRRASAIIQRLRDMMRRDSAARERLDLCQVVREVREIMRSGLTMRGITVVPDFAADLPTVVADRIQIQQVVMNLVTNAMQAMDGLVEARLTLRVRCRDDGWQIVSVIDSGPGIEPSMVDTLFEPFTTSRAGGLGMGLSISRNIIESHSGQIWAENGPDGGASVSFGLPPGGSAQ
ncbi:MAG: PAS domain S-box protein [Vicinamibacterales bacterium]|nr:PAS domain S-box protein [Vicinamibacterales bacterium]